MTVEMLVAGRYQIGPCLGMGGMGRVWLARDEVLRRDVAIKEIALPFGLTDEEREEMRNRTLREARAAARLSHPNVVRIYDVQHGDERPWIVMEYVPSRSLLQVIKENGPLPPDQAAGIGLAVLSALDAAFRVGVLHRDIKPSNVLIAHDGRVLLTDFGSAIMDEGEGALTRTGIIVGSPHYIAPERAHNGTSTLESDLWSLGATLYEAVEGRGPYTRETTMATLVALATEKPDPVQKAGPLKPVLHGLLQKNPQARMPLPEVEERLRRIADVQNAVTLRSVPAPRTAVEFELGQAVILAGSDDRMAERLPNPPLPVVAPAMSPQLDPAAVYPVARAGPPISRRRRRWALVAVGAATAAAIVAGTAAYGLMNGDAPRSKGEQLVAGNGAGLGAAARPGDPTATPVTTSPQPPLPAGYAFYTSKSGFKVAWPAKWVKVDATRSSVTLCAPGGPPLITVRDWTRSDPNLSAAMTREETLTAAGVRDYKRIRMDVSAQGAGAEWEYTFTDPKHGKLRGVERAVIAAGRAHLVQFRAPAAKWTQHRNTLAVVLDTFRAAAPPPATAQNALPAGFTRFVSPSGFQVARPTKWTKVPELSKDDHIAYCAPGGPPLLVVGPWTPSSPTLMNSIVDAERQAKLESYKRISMEVLPDESGAIWEYIYTDPKMGRLHALDRIFVTRSGAVHVVQWRTPATKWAANLPALGVVTTSFNASSP